MTPELAYKVSSKFPYAHTLELVKIALKAEGFGVLTFIDLKTTISEKIGAELRSYAILKACNHLHAHEALSTDPIVGMYLPYNVTAEDGPQDGSIVRIGNPEELLRSGSLVPHEALKKVVRDAHARLLRVSAALDGE